MHYYCNTLVLRLLQWEPVQLTPVSFQQIPIIPPGTCGVLSPPGILFYGEAVNPSFACMEVPKGKEMLQFL